MRTLCSLLLAGMLCLEAVVAFSQEPFKSPFRYAIIYNGGDVQRSVVVLLDRDAFSEARLIELFTLLKQRFPSPLALFVDVSVSLDDIMTPEEFDQARIPHATASPPPNANPKAYLIRDGLGNERISYTMNPRLSDRLKEIVIKRVR